LFSRGGFGGTIGLPQLALGARAKKQALKSSAGA
jgi:hypothetical protein